MRNLGEIRAKKLELKQKIDIKEKEILESGERLIEPIIQFKDKNVSIKNKFSFGVNAFQWFMTGRQIWRLFGGLSQLKNKHNKKKKKTSSKLKGITTIIKLISKFSR